MSVELVDGATIIRFVEDEEAFGASIRERFSHLDVDGDGVLSYFDMSNEFGIDNDSNRRIDLDEFMIGAKKMMLAIADGMGFLPIQMVLEKDSFLMKAVQREAGQIIQ